MFNIAIGIPVVRVVFIVATWNEWTLPDPVAGKGNPPKTIGAVSVWLSFAIVLRNRIWTSRPTL